MPRVTNRAKRSVELIQQSLLGLAKGLGGLLPLLNGQAAPAAPDAHRTLKLSPQVRALRKLQGTYMGYLRSLKPRQKTRVKTLRSAKGYPAAVKLARRLRQSKELVAPRLRDEPWRQSA